MTSDPAANYSDTDKARRLSALLRRQGGPEDRRQATSPAVGYIRFQNFVATPHPSSPAPPHIEVKAASSEFGAGRWESVLEQCARAVSGEAAFVLDAHGFQIAAWGALSEDNLASLGARVPIALEQLGRAELGAAHARALAIDFDGRWVSVFSLTVPDSGAVAVGIVGRAPLAPAERVVIEEAVRASVT